MKMRMFVTIVACCILFGFVPGCTPEQIEQLDKVAADANAIGGGLSETADGPAGRLLPARVRSIMQMLGVSAAVAMWFWQQNRHRLTRTTLKAVAKGVDGMDVQDRDQLKAEIGVEMKRMAQGRPGVTYSKLNTELDRVKA